MNLVEDLFNEADCNSKKVMECMIKHLSTEEDVNIKGMTKDHIFKAGLIIFRKLVGPDILSVKVPGVQDSGEEHMRATQSQSQIVAETETNEDAVDVNKDKGEEAKPCYFYRAGRCKYSASSCKFLHQKICKKYRKNGRSENGCQLGKDCPNLHVILCPSSYRNRVCEKGEDCKYKYHIKSPKYPATTKEKEENFKTPNPFLGFPKAEDRMSRIEGQMAEMANIIPLLKNLLTTVSPWQMQQGPRNLAHA